jgi:hypothetical protein
MTAAPSAAILCVAHRIPITEADAAGAIRDGFDVLSFAPFDTEEWLAIKFVFRSGGTQTLLLNPHVEGVLLNHLEKRARRGTAR